MYENLLSDIICLKYNAGIASNAALAQTYFKNLKTKLIQQDELLKKFMLADLELEQLKGKNTKEKINEFFANLKGDIC
jgi:hypothetical protein